VREGDAEFEALREAIDAFGKQRAPELVAEARAEALAKARSMLSEAIAQSLLDHAGAELAGAPPPRPAPKARAPGTEPARATPRPAPAAEPDGCYVYGVVSAAGAELPPDVPGVDSRHTAMLIEHRGLAAIVSPVSLEEFGEEQLHENLNDVSWLEEKARAHERVLDEALSRMTVVPMRLCTIYRGSPQVEEMLDSEREVFVDALRRLEGKAEWGVKLIAEPGALDRAAATGGSPADSGEVSAGTAYMRGKSLEAKIREEADRIAAEWAEDVHGRLAGLVAEALLNPLQNPEVSGHEGDMLLNGVYLVADDEVEAFHATAEQLGEEYEERGVAVELTGPWPPYNFVKGSIEAAR
jgi:gas vesicle protein GvpL/GvpF